MSDTEVVITTEDGGEDENQAAEVATATTAAEATVAASGAEESADDAEAAALQSWLDAESAWLAADVAGEAASDAANTVAAQQQQIDQLLQVSQNLVEAARLQAEGTASTVAGELPDPGTTDASPAATEETAPESNHWMTKQWFGKKKG